MGIALLYSRLEVSLYTKIILSEDGLSAYNIKKDIHDINNDHTYKKIIV